MFQETVHEQQEHTPQADHFSGPKPQVLPPNQNTNRVATKPIRLNSVNIVFLFLTPNSMVRDHSTIQ
jgi:hypothetical protein